MKQHQVIAHDVRAFVASKGFQGEFPWAKSLNLSLEVRQHLYSILYGGHVLGRSRQSSII